jgi:hypothetical protein
MRPKSIAAIAEEDPKTPGAFDHAVREFLDAWQSMSAMERSAA